MSSVCVFCGARPGTDPAFMEAAEKLGTALATAGHRLVYGAGDIGLMGSVARACQEAGGETFGVIPTHLLDMEVAKRDLGRLVITETMHERKKVMFTNSDVIVMLPGGAGTLDEIFEVITWWQLGLHTKPIHFLDVAGYWQPLLALIDNVIDKGFAQPSLKDAFQVHPDLPSLTRALGSA